MGRRGSDDGGEGPRDEGRCRPTPETSCVHLHALLEAAALPRIRFHDLRHSAASLLIAAGVELVEVSMLLGHSELRVTADWLA